MRPPRAAGTLIVGGRLITPLDEHRPGWVEVVGDLVVAVGAGPPPRPADVDLPGATIVPGFVDAHVHGGGGASYTDGDPDAAAVAVAAHLRAGTTTTVASLVTAPLADLERSVTALADLVDDGLLAGLHLEGPWLSPSHRGAHDPGLLRAPEPSEVERLLVAGRGRIAMVTLAPELPGGLAAIERVVGHGAVAAIGHTDASDEVTRAALDAGARAGTHLFNGMRGLHHREPGPALALLEDERAHVELVADGVHLHPAVLRGAARAAGQGRFVLVTDAMAAAGAPDGDYRLGALAVSVRGGAARLAGSGQIAGSTLTLRAAIAHATGAAGLPLADAVRAATLTPATLLGLPGRGALRPGSRADLVALDADLGVRAVMRAGQWVS